MTNYVSIKERERGVTSSEDYIEKCEEGLRTANRNDTDNTKAKRMRIIRKNGKKQICRRFKRLIRNIIHEKTWTWLRKRNLKSEIESFLISAQNNTIRTNRTKTKKDNFATKPANVIYVVIETKRSIA